MTYRITREDLGSITDLDLAFSTERLLPPWEEIPSEFKRGNVYTELVDALFFGAALPDAEMSFRPGFNDDGAAAALNRSVRAHLQSYGTKHEHKIAGIGYLIAQVCEIART